MTKVLINTITYAKHTPNTKSNQFKSHRKYFCKQLHQKLSLCYHLHENMTRNDKDIQTIDTCLHDIVILSKTIKCLDKMIDMGL